MKKLICCSLFFNLLILNSFACDEWTDKKTGQTYRSGDPADCEFEENKKDSKLPLMGLNNFISKRENLKNIPQKIRGIIKHPTPCPVCPTNHQCKMCYRSYFVFESRDGETKLMVNFKPESKILNKVTSNREVVLLIQFLGSSGSGEANPTGFYELVSDIVF